MIIEERNAFFSPRRYENYEIEGLGTVRVRSWTAADKNAYEAGHLDERGRIVLDKLKTANARMIAASVVRPSDDKLMFGEADIDDLMQMDSAISDKLVAVIEQHLASATVGELAKNCNGTPAGALLSA